ncbi:MAG TPA: hypothetical protein DEH78_12780 [Solibacterales bacterium]|nr:hypothetical protein [Bryobacterales bacterium]
MPDRRRYFAFALLLAACGAPEKGIDLPAHLAGREGGPPGPWTRVSLTPVPSAAIPETARQLGLAEAVEAAYSGEIKVTVYRMRSETAAFELLQKWRRQENTLPFQRGALLLVPACADAAVLQSFTRALAAPPAASAK